MGLKSLSRSRQHGGIDGKIENSSRRRRGIVALQIKSKLEQKGYEVVGMFASGEELLETVASLTPDLIMMDMTLQESLTA